ncbi:SDR family oxidoreductase [Actinomadura logoneensis]|uniref:SDR family oxidoreductase n=1 Tax=Actinomadura logoneensis TaxID=2293572 RepID=A0A372JHP2_9ACTN|nr:SDR family oxidoreductase [Actinomadura logoneensis]RFU39542.1 SDR family oxidoreductase [Actinomadura logoneensis]
MRISLITGANKGIGFETARRIGGTVLVGARDEERGRAAERALRDEGVEARFVRIDVTDETSVRSAAAWIDGEYGRLDALVNNAGVSLTRAAPSDTSAELLRRTYEPNVFGVVTVTNAMLPLLRRSPAGRVVNVSSELGSLALNTDPASPFREVNLLAYNSSKAAVNMITVCYAKELADTGIKVNAVNPGYCATDMNGHQGVRTAAQGAAPAVWAATLGEDGPTGAFFSDDGPHPW